MSDAQAENLILAAKAHLDHTQAFCKGGKHKLVCPEWDTLNQAIQAVEQTTHEKRGT